RCRAQRAGGVDHVLAQVAHVFTPAMCRLGRAIDGGDVVARVLEIAELTHRLGAGRVRREAERAQLLDAHVEVEAELLVDVVADLAARSPRESEETPAHRVTPARAP